MISFDASFISICSLFSDQDLCRFAEPASSNYPSMIEPFSGRPDFQIGREDIHLAPLPVTAEISSLSAVMLDDDDRLMLQGRKTVSGVTLPDGLQSLYLLHA